MIFDSDGTTTIVHQENATLKIFIKNLLGGYDQVKNDHIIVNLFSFSELTTNDVMEFLEISNKHRASKKSFVLVSERISYDDAPEELAIAPTIQEAKDIIEMEEIERDLGL